VGVEAAEGFEAVERDNVRRAGYAIAADRDDDELGAPRRGV
jgi:hypothetical protein